MTTHTPGPWKCVRHEHGIAIQTENGAHIAGLPIVAGLQFPNEANARLIAAAPELLKALKQLHNEIIGLTAYLETCDPEVIAENLDSILASARNKTRSAEAAILKTGGTV